PGNPEASAANIAARALRLRRTLLIPRANGNASLFARSALGRYAKRPKKLQTARDLYRGIHKPMEYRVLDTDGQTVLMSGLVITCAGVAIAAEIMRDLGSDKTRQRFRRMQRWLGPLHRPIRLGYEL